MESNRQRIAAKRNIKKAQAAWRSMSHRERALAQPEGRSRAKPGTKGGGDFYHVQVRPKTEFKTFRVQRLGTKGEVERLAGKRLSGSWDTVKWMIAKNAAHEEGNKLVGDTAGVRKVFNKLGAVPIHVRGDVFKAKPRPNVPEWEKPTFAQRRAQQENIKKAQAARRHRKAA